MRRSQQCHLCVAFKGSKLYPIMWFWFVYFLECYLGQSNTFTWCWFIHTNKPEQQASKRMLWLPCIKHPCRTFAFLLSTEKSMNYNKTSESLSEIRNTDGFNPRREVKALQHYLWWPCLYLFVSVAFLFLVPPSYFLLITLFWGGLRPYLGSVFTAQGRDQSCG